MIVMNPLNGLGATLPLNNGMVQAAQARDVHALNRIASGSRLSVTSRGMGAIAGVPTWAWAAGGGLVAGLVAGAMYFRRKRR